MATNISQVSALALTSSGDARVSQVSALALTAGGDVRISQVSAIILYRSSPDFSFEDPDMAFDEVQFPAPIARGSRGGFRFATDKGRLGSGGTYRSARWQVPYRWADVGTGVKTFEDMLSLLSFAAGRLGGARGFRYPDPHFYHTAGWDGQVANAVTSADQTLGTADAGTRTFQLRYALGDASNTVYWNIRKPRAGTVRVQVDGVEVAETTQWTVDTTTGIVTLVDAALTGEVRAGCEFDIPMYFATDELGVDYEDANLGAIGPIPLAEIRYD